MAASAVLLAATGAGFLFAGDILGASLVAAPVPRPLASLLGVALFTYLTFGPGPRPRT